MSILPASGMGDESTGFYSETIDQSVRFNGSSSQLNITPSSTGNRRTFTTSLWIKRSGLGSTMELLTGGSNVGGQPSTQFRINSSDELSLYDTPSAGTSAQILVESNAVLRDTANWYHVMVSVDTTQSTASDRVKLYINGSEVTYSATTYPSQNYDTNRNRSGQVHRIGRFPNVAVNFFDGYMAEFNHIDGTALDPTSFGQTKNGVWIPKALSGLTYGTNGFRLTFADSSSLGDDTSGNGNDFTSSGLSASGPVSDSPTNNFSTLNSIGNDNQATFSEGNLKISFPQDINAQPRCEGTFAVSSGKWYWEVNVISITTANTPMIGIKDLSVSNHENHIFSGSSVYAYYANSGNKYNSGNLGSYGATYTAGDIIGVALDLDAGTLTFYKNNSSQGAAFSSLSGEYTLHLGTGYYAWVGVVNFGQDGTFAGNETAQGNTDDNGIGDFYYSPPSGHLALCSSNLPDTTISPNKGTQADDHFNTVLYTGNATDTNITGVGFQPDWIWVKNRSNTYHHALVDSSRGATKILKASDSAVEGTFTEQITGFLADGFSVGDNSDSGNYVNINTHTYVAWNWKANGGTTSSNSDGSITSTVQANTTAGFSIVTYTGNDTAGATIGHGLGVKPAWILVKRRTGSAQDWIVYHHKNTSAPATDYLMLNRSDYGTLDSNVMWNDTEPTTSVITLGDHNSTNEASQSLLAYVFAEVEGYSKFGSYRGNSSSDGTFVFTGFRPAWLMVRKTSGGDNWVIHDSVRDPDNVVQKNLLAETSSSEGSDNSVDFLSNGFKWRVNSGARNTSGQTYVYMAFAEQPFKFSNAR